MTVGTTTSDSNTAVGQNGETCPLPPLLHRKNSAEKAQNASQTRLPQVTPRGISTPKEPVVKRRVQSATAKREHINQVEKAPSPGKTSPSKASSPGKVSPNKARIKSLERIVTYKQTEKNEKEAGQVNKQQKELETQMQKEHALAAKRRRRAEIYAINAAMRTFCQAKLAEYVAQNTQVAPMGV
ncbi:hypothetical protein THRCLA_04307 [Thraustotheca clavata]|uniref:Small vasohibin-binding protein n=1 Tax=Thraustotheca clavata TaxID=74557 RepID=A0A1V9ZZC7_9STRA|nr:hypothetical protein THRCLA_04307 [Thraustotheca clavata]